jgi:hypothetical protein
LVIRNTVINRFSLSCKQTIFVINNAGIKDIPRLRTLRIPSPSHAHTYMQRAAGLRDGMVPKTPHNPDNPLHRQQVLYVKLKETASRVESITDHSPASIDPARVTHSPSTGTNTGAGSTPNSSSLLDEHATMLADKGNPRDITISGISCQVRSQGNIRLFIPLTFAALPP